jgi:hypothetical protein
MASNEWTTELNQLLRRWKQQIGRREQGHREMSRRYTRWHYVFGVPSTIMSTLVSTGILSTFRNCTDQDENCQLDEWIRLTSGIIGYASVVLIALQTFLSYQSRSANHKRSADDYGSLYRTIDSLLLLPGQTRGDPVNILQDIRTKYDDLTRRSLTLPQEYDQELTYKICAREHVDERNSVDEEVTITFDLDDIPRSDIATAARAIAKLSSKSSPVHASFQKGKERESL